MNFSRLTSGEEGLRLLARIKHERPALPVVLMTAWGTIELAVAGMRAGAADFLTKPWSHDQLLRSVRTALGVAALEVGSGKAPTRAELAATFDLSGVIGEAPAFLSALDVICKVAPTEAPVLVTGETGTGKEVAAELLHRASPRRDGPLVKVNLGGMPAALFESEMFGHVRGAFTDAREDRLGRFAAAAGGTIFLDEVGELDPICQVKLLRVLQDRTFEPLGSSRSQKADVRVVSATNRDLDEAIRAGRLREDLYYRLNLITVRLPALVDRRGDVALLARHFLEAACDAWGRPAMTLAPDGLRWLEARRFPGNVRELRHIVERATILAAGAELGAIEFERADASTEAGQEPSLPGVGTMTIDEMERAMIAKSMRHHGGNLSKVAESLGLSRAALYRRLEKYGMRA